MTECQSYPQVVDGETLKTAVKMQKQGYRLLPAIGIGIMDKASGSLGILNELQDISIINNPMTLSGSLELRLLIKKLFFL